MCEVLFFSISSPGKLFYLFNSSAPALSFHLSLSLSLLLFSTCLTLQCLGVGAFLLSYYAKFVYVCVCACDSMKS